MWRARTKGGKRAKIYPLKKFQVFHVKEREKSPTGHPKREIHFFARFPPFLMTRHISLVR